MAYLLPAAFVVAWSLSANSELTLAAGSGLLSDSQLSALEGPSPTATAIPPGNEDGVYGTNGKYTWSKPSSVIESANLLTDGSLLVTFDKTSLLQAGGDHIAPNGDFHDAFTSTCRAGCSLGNGSAAAIATPKAPPRTLGNPLVHIGGMDGFELTVFTFDGTVIEETVIDLGGGNAAAPGIAYLGGTRYAVSGFSNENFIFGEVNTNPPQVVMMNTVDISTNDFGFDVGFPPVLGAGSATGYAVGRGGNSMILCKATFPGAVLVSSFGAGGCVITDLGGGSAVEGREVAMLPDGDAVVAGMRSGRFFVAVFDGTTGDLDPTFDGDGIWIESVAGSTESQGWSVVTRGYGIFALGWIRVGGVRELLAPVFDGYELDSRYENGGLIRAPMVGTEGFPISLKVGVPPPPGNDPELRIWAAGTESGFNQGFVYRFAAVEPTRGFFDGFETGDGCRWSSAGATCPAPRLLPPHPAMSSWSGSPPDAP
ncbi:MAG: hypothetical protein K8J08_04315 [Thermoanaerobaculia bacterium]|nr:hypothetical protein [Thermoanaerobaculia bacterium]